VWRWTLSFLLLLSITSPASALEKQCYDDSISQVSQSGEIIKLASGHIYEIDSYDTFDTKMWLPAEDVLICETSDVRQGRVITIYDIINTDQGGGKVWAHKIK